MKIEGAETDKWIKLLQGVRFFHDFDDGDLRRMLDAGEVLHFNFHEYVFKEKELDHSLFIILKGRVKIIKTGPLMENKELGYLDAGSCFGEMGLLLKEGRSASVLTADESYIFKINAKDIESMPESTQVKMYRHFAEELASKLKSTTEEIVRPTLF